MSLLANKRNKDGSFGELEKVFEGKTEAEKVERLESENTNLTFSLLEKDMRMDAFETVQAEIILQLLGGAPIE